jgi:hypothetical protein
MVIKIYKDNLIMTPVKCGTRYLDKVWKYERVEYTHNDFLNFPKVKYVIVRPPIEHLLTALHTEILKHVNESNKENDFYHQLKYFTSPNGVAHWCSQLYEYFYYYKNRYNHHDVNIVKLENLTELIKSLGYETEYNPEEYHFKEYKKWWSKEELFELLKENYPEEINWLLNKVEEQNNYYYKLINNELDKKVLDRFKQPKLI